MRLRNSVPMMVAALRLMAPWAHAEEEAELAKKLGERMERASVAWYQLPVKYRPRHEAMVKEFVDTLSEDELRVAGRHLPDDDFNQAVFARWGFLDPWAAMAAARTVEDANAKEISLAGTGLEGGPGEAISGYVHELYLGAFEGWTRKDAKSAWRVFKAREGAFEGSQVVGDYSYYYYETAFKQLARVDASFAFAEMLSLRDDEYRFTAMLTGYLDGAPDGQDWEKQVNALLQWKWKHGGVYLEIRRAFLGRWLKDAPAAAEKWFAAGEVEDLHWEWETTGDDGDDPFREDQAQPKASEKKRSRHRIDAAVGFWAARDFNAAFAWMKTHDCFKEGGFALDAMAGTERHFGDEDEARRFLLRQLAALPSEEDRGLFAVAFAKVLWVFDDTGFLGEPAPDKNAWLTKVEKSLEPLKLSTEAARAVLEQLR